MASKLRFFLIFGIVLVFGVSVQNYLKFVSDSISPLKNQTAIFTIVQNSIHNPEVQQMLQAQILLYLKSAEGKENFAKLLKSPEMVKAMADNLHSPEFRPTLIQLLHEPEFQTALLEIIRNTPEMRVLKLLNSAVEWNVQLE